MADLQLIRIMLVDDQEMIRLGLALMLKNIDGLIVAGEAVDGESAILLCDQIMPDIILMDMLMPGMDGVTAIRTIHQSHPSVRVIVVSGFESEEQVKGALEAGAVGYLPKTITAEELAVAIHAVVAGLNAMMPRILKVLTRNVAPEAASMIDSLTAREKEVLSLMTEGDSNPQIAKKLTVVSTTIKSHVSNILSKLNVSNRTEAVALVLLRKLEL